MELAAARPELHPSKARLATAMGQTDVDLDRLRSEMMDYMRQTGLPIFYALGNPEDDDYTFWDTSRFPDWRQFVDVAKEGGARLLAFSSESLSDSDLEVACEKLDECDMSPEERLAFSKQFEIARKHMGQTAWVRIAFEHGGRWLAYDRMAPWYDDFRSALEDLEAYLPFVEEEEEDDDSGRGFFSRN